MCEECLTNLFLLILSYLGLVTKLAKQHKNHLCLLSICKAMLKLNMPNVLQVICETTVTVSVVNMVVLCINTLVVKV